MLTTFIIIALLALAVWLYVRPRDTQPRVPMHVENQVDETLAGLNHPDLSEDEEAMDRFFGGGGQLGKFRMLAIGAAKAEFGMLKRTEANRLMVRKYLKAWMERTDLRKSHMYLHLDFCTNCSFVPTAADIEAHQIGATRAALTAQSKLHTWWESAYGSFGRMVGFKSE